MDYARPSGRNPNHSRHQNHPDRRLFDAFIRRLRSNSSTPKKWGGMGMFMNSRIGYDDPAGCGLMPILRQSGRHFAHSTQGRRAGHLEHDGG